MNYKIIADSQINRKNHEQIITDSFHLFRETVIEKFNKITEDLSLPLQTTISLEWEKSFSLQNKGSNSTSEDEQYDLFLTEMRLIRNEAKKRNWKVDFQIHQEYSIDFIKNTDIITGTYTCFTITLSP